MIYTIDQQEALASMILWSNADITKAEDLLYTLDGAAGTGKTTIVREFLQRLNLKASKIAVTAPTHKAKKVIQDATDYNSQTIQKLLGLRPDVNMDDFDVNKPVFNPLAEDEIQYYKFVIIDESSMLNKEAYKLIKERAIKYKVKIIFLGDAYQLPPINEKISMVFSDVINKSTLTTIVRQGDDNPMSIILKMLRADIKYGTENGIKKLIEIQKHIENEKGFHCLSSKLDENYGTTTFGSELLPYYFSTEYTVNKNFIKFLAYTNDSIEQWSKALRDKLLKEDANNIINVGEVLTGYVSITDRKTNILVIENSEDYTVTEVIEGISNFGVQGFFVRLENSRGSTKTVFIVDHNNIEVFKEICIAKLNLATSRRGSYWVAYYAFKNAHLLLKNVAKDDRRPITEWGNLLCKKDLYYGYGCTVHKSQGSTYDNVAINLQNLYNNRDVSERARLVYVALSRTRNMNLILVK